ncbi:MAG: PD40 domain-containing protein [Planctomycetaceae bacterium]|nr:PD40 domain-containing protein [Planctomycetaceae bacterium]
MESFAAIMKGGESGAAIEPGNGDGSNLCIQIADGSMPQEADPLTAGEIALVQRWVTLGARLDAGVNPATQLLQIMPKRPQPAAPPAYPVAIPVTALAFSPDGSKLASSGYHEVILWNVADQAVAQRITNVAERVYDVAFHPDGQRLAIASGTPGMAGEVKIFNLADGALLADLVTVEDAMFGVAFNPDGSKLAACGADRSIRVFDVASGKEEVHVEDHADWVMDIHWSPDGTKLVSASRDKTSKIFDAKSGDALVTFNGHGEPVNSAVFLPDGTAVASAARDKQVRIWQVTDAKELRKIGGYGDDVLRIEILPDSRLFSVSADKQGRSHNAADGAAIKSYAGHADWVYSLAVHSATGMLATGSYDGEIRLWKIDDATQAANWTAAPGYVSQQASAK